MREVRATAHKGRADDALRSLEEAVEALSQDDVIRAQRAATRAKQLAPRSAAARETLGLSLYLGERFQEAVRELLAYRRLTDRADHNPLIADCYRALGAPEKAVALARETLDAQVDEAIRTEAVIVAGAALADLGRYEEALTVLHRVPTTVGMARPHHLRLWYVIADVLERAGRPEQAAEMFGRILRHDPEAFDAAERLGALERKRAE